jgi:hypothetical protein
MRRFTRLTNAFSRKVKNLAAAVSLHFMYYNFARAHMSLANPIPVPPRWRLALPITSGRSRRSSPCLGSRRDPWDDPRMLWVIKRRWQILAVGLVLLLLGSKPSGPGTDVRAVLYGVGSGLVFFATLAVLLAIPMGLKARRGAPRSPD